MASRVSGLGKTCNRSMVIDASNGSMASDGDDCEPPNGSFDSGSVRVESGEDCRGRGVGAAWARCGRGVGAVWARCGRGNASQGGAGRGGWRRKWMEVGTPNLKPAFLD